MKLVNLEEIKSILTFENNAIYTMILIARKKNNSNITNSQEIVFRETIKKLKHFNEKIDKFLAIAKNKDEEFKIYITFNPRDTLKAYKLLKYEFADWDEALTKSEQSVEQTIEKIKRIDSKFISCLQKSPLKKMFYMIDLDDKSKLDEVTQIFENTTESKILHKFETKNGFHLLFKPCDTREFIENAINKNRIDCELKKDDLLCIGYEK